MNSVDSPVIEVVGDSPDLQVVLLQHCEPKFDVAGLSERQASRWSPDTAISRPSYAAGGPTRDFLEGQVGPLAGEQGLPVVISGSFCGGDGELDDGGLGLV